jgi:hypothetical protein
MAIDTLDRQYVELLIQLATFYSSAGYTEKAVGILQATIEFSCLAPKQRKNDASAYDYDTLLQLFEAFWDSEAPRVGEAVCCWCDSRLS